MHNKLGSLGYYAMYSLSSSFLQSIIVLCTFCGLIYTFILMFLSVLILAFNTKMRVYIQSPQLSFVWRAFPLDCNFDVVGELLIAPSVGLNTDPPCHLVVN